MFIFAVLTCNEETQPNSHQDDRPAVRPAFPMPGQVLHKEHPPNCGHDRAWDREPSCRFPASEHADEKQKPNADNKEGPEVAPKIRPGGKLACQRQKTEQNEQASPYQ